MDTNATTTEADALEGLHHGCFACGSREGFGLHLRFDTSAGGVATAVWRPAPLFQSYPGRLHGGVIATLLDAAMVHALSARGVAGVTVEMNIRYARGVSVADPIEVTGRVESVRHGVYFCRAELLQAGGAAVRAAAKFMALSDPAPDQSLKNRAPSPVGRAR